MHLGYAACHPLRNERINVSPVYYNCTRLAESFLDILDTSSLPALYSAFRARSSCRFLEIDQEEAAAAAEVEDDDKEEVFGFSPVALFFDASPWRAAREMV